MQTRPSDDLVPLVKFPSRHRREPQLYIVDPTSRPSSRSRRKGNVDTKRFNESGTGKEITSLVSIKRHLVGEVDERRLSRSTKFYEKRRTEQDNRKRSKDFVLPQGWTVEARQRRDCSQIDKYYTEQETGKRFRSLVSAERYLNSVGNGTVSSVSKVHSERVPLLAICNGTGYENVVIDPNPPEKVKWVLTGPEGDMFSANVMGSDVSSSVKQTWSETFVSLIQDRC
ncbi:Methyl-CpG-binding domain-containing protein 7 [Raphanus sativus]|uniref:Methyl-CpG-binding domain-containing protein 7-like n=1 Tax=Raphanus sativus TaxID=3726 RepID=A0A6J0L371_RAPSA|nr:methyl-CpG-binding domain-containing protein 7-like [Raphanus sativus]KAJ4911015.1 Methyl-CpG-binding domain-containing protein 7 [Raphanus sativus]